MPPPNPQAILLGLSRITALLPRPFTIPTIHVAGTNGKGSICTYLSAMLRQTGLRAGRFTSPHLLHRSDGISINAAPVPASAFSTQEALVRARNAECAIGASDFEVLTATAFALFERERVAMAVVECGMGGLTDATNVLARPVVCVISNIGLDHQAFLGDTLEQIAAHKAGIIKPGAVCVVDGSNTAAVLGVVRAAAAAQGVRLVATPRVGEGEDAAALDALFASFGITRAGLEWTQQRNVLCAYYAIREAMPLLKTMYEPERGGDEAEALRLATVMRGAQVQGRYQDIDIAGVVQRPSAALIDGAHNADAWASLARFVDARRGGGRAVVWVMALSNSRPVDQLVGLMVRPQDAIVFTEFGAVEGMPWVKPTDCATLAARVQAANKCKTVDHASDVKLALKKAVDIQPDSLVVIAGSLYLVSDVFRLLGTQQQTPSLNDSS